MKFQNILCNTYDIQNLLCVKRSNTFVSPVYTEGIELTV